jgi:dihydroxyacetone kinase
VAHLYNDPANFADEFIVGFVAANGQWVRRVSGGVVRSAKSQTGQVAVVIGGGSGHYPAFGGLVGQGLAHGAAMGNLFASPSAQQVYSVAKAAESGGGLFFTYGNYAGDVLNFDQAQMQLLEEGVPCRTVVVTDDISSASPAEIAKRRGVAGDLCIFKIAAAAAEAGANLDEVSRLASRANDRTRSFGVAFSGCTLPGASDPLFTIPAGRMGVGMGIHGEAGIAEADIPSANELAQLLVDKLLREVPNGVQVQGARITVILNGLGSVKYEELFVLYGRIAQLLAEQGLIIIEPEVGELVTSFEMAGVSLTLFWLDDELEPLWHAPAYTPAYRKGSVTNTEFNLLAAQSAELPTELIDQASKDSRSAAKILVDVLSQIQGAIDENADDLGRLDAIAGDGDHGIGMQRGATAAALSAQRLAVLGAGAGTLLIRAGDAWADRAGGTSGALWGLALRAMGSALGDENFPNSNAAAAGIREAKTQIARYGKAQLGDKTLLDALIPFSEALDDALLDGADLTQAWGIASKIADRAAEATAELRPKIGRARPHADKSVGTPDPGAVSMALVIRTVHKVLLARDSQNG